MILEPTESHQADNTILWISRSLTEYLNNEQYDFVLLQELFDEAAREYIESNRDTSVYQSVVSRIDYTSFPELPRFD